VSAQRSSWVWEMMIRRPIRFTGRIPRRANLYKVSDEGTPPSWALACFMLRNRAIWDLRCRDAKKPPRWAAWWVLLVSAARWRPWVGLQRLERGPRLRSLKELQVILPDLSVNQSENGRHGALLGCADFYPAIEANCCCCHESSFLVR